MVVYILDIIFTIFIACLFIAAIVLKIKKKFVWILLGSELVLMVIFGSVGMSMAFYLVTALFIVSTLISLFSNLSEIRNYFAITIDKAKINISDKKDVSNKKENKEKLIKDITTAVKWLSDTKTGALITFERNDSLDNYIKSGTVINCPITPEIIETIFFEGTRLHDGAIIIRGNTIVAAAVFFKATTKILVGKYGARHRAAIGISENSDAITIVVSEETGRISITYAGGMESVKYDDFEKVFSSFVYSSKKEIETK